MLTKQSEDFAKWYNEVVLTSDLAEYSPVKGCMIIKPYGYAIWENIQKNLDIEIKKMGVKNVYFPLFIPERFFKKEAEHVQGFNPQVAWVTHGGGKKLEERLAVRPTSETIMGDVFKKWIQSYRDLPLKINQWANIVRWEMRPRLFLRTLEFLWQEGHTLHSTKKEADEMAMAALKMYQNFAQDWLSIYCVSGRKTEAEKFAGALYTLSVEALMKDGKALQMGTSHQLGQNFSKSFGIQFLDEKGKKNYVWQTSWGVSTRMIGGIVMAHGDDRGLILPPKIAPYQIVIIPISTDKKIKNYISKIEKILLTKEIRFNTDWRTQQTPGWKFNDWELKGVPLRIEIGPKEVKANKITFVSRDILKRETIDLKRFEPEKLLNYLQKRLLEKSKKFTKDNIREADSYDQFKKLIKEKGGFIKTHWCGDAKCEKKIQEETKATIRCILFENKNKTGKCIKCGKQSKTEVLFAKAY
ncbi:MAG: proline--tRNA ligase [Candidatus Portnoybacteria bacterium CG10_big_fil_rev_8_21_14_0_10_38_18]|uniref:Proline--tRNA ligase n=1 Tax=Candidatus Portnoybacteria bacterium CG10_big_fil_rev_8_21_14_0_10_38_18 TaxID=1974813 RepID=A0A2M8KC35_9BACT|nr:MAG: proline--tRNA ligase [Candidatus Portnoybacteria bacterium CG10_big_fil_rev_8_21_14_0_10_38_18]